jgi:hypothetical protein
MRPPPWDIRRKGRRWTADQLEARLLQCAERFESDGNLFVGDASA